MSYTDQVTEDLRLRMLQVLAAAPSYTANEVALAAALEGYGHRVARDVRRAQLTWLAEQGHIIVQQPGGVWVATISAAGLDAAEGRGAAYGVARPRPE